MKVACVQMCSGLDREANLAAAAHCLQQAADLGAELALLPETFAFMGDGLPVVGQAESKQGSAEAEDPSHSATLRFLSAQAVAHHMAIVGGTLLLKGEAGRMRNVCPVFAADGKLLALYDKIHLFDMDYQGECYHESAYIDAGREPVSVRLDAGVIAGSGAGDYFKLGLSVCYDLRFPELFRMYAADECNILCNVAAFTAVTGRAHWEVLLRARAIENQAYVLASAQTGTHPDGRQTWGHSMIIDPWGRVISVLAAGEGVIVADVVKQQLHQVRESLPALQHRCL